MEFAPVFHQRVDRNKIRMQLTRVGRSNWRCPKTLRFDEPPHVRRVGHIKVKRGMTGMGAEHDVAAIDELADGALKAVCVGGVNILIGRDETGPFAVGATCPHAGGPLADGARNGNRIVCPWHKATFCLRSGALLEPPAVDDLPRYPVRTLNGRVLVGDQALNAGAPPTPEGAGSTYVIVGGGAAGASAAQTLRAEGFDGAIVMLDRENRVPYDRTLLSKYHLSGAKGGEKTPLQTQAWYRAHGIERRTAEVTHIDVAARQIRCADGASLTYDKVLVATGATPTVPQMPGCDLRNVFTLRSRADADAILAQAERSTRAVVLGASFIGMEVAAALRERGLDVTVVGKERAPFEKQLGARIGQAFVKLHEQHGVVFRLGADIAALEGLQSVAAVRLSDAETIPADLVVIGFGVTPATDALRDLRRENDGGIAVDETLCAAADVYVAGDIAAFPYRGGRVRVEHWRVAQQHGRVAARNMLGRATRFDAAPVFWTIQYMKRLDYIGHASDWDEVVLHGDVETPNFLAYYVKGGQVVAAVGMDRDADTAALVELLAMRDWTPHALGETPSAILKAMRR